MIGHCVKCEHTSQSIIAIRLSPDLSIPTKHFGTALEKCHLDIAFTFLCHHFKIIAGGHAGAGRHFCKEEGAPKEVVIRRKRARHMVKSPPPPIKRKRSLTWRKTVFDFPGERVGQAPTLAPPACAHAGGIVGVHITVTPFHYDNTTHLETVNLMNLHPRAADQVCILMSYTNRQSALQ